VLPSLIKAQDRNNVRIPMVSEVLDAATNTEQQIIFYFGLVCGCLLYPRLWDGYFLQIACKKKLPNCIWLILCFLNSIDLTLKITILVWIFIYGHFRTELGRVICKFWIIFPFASILPILIYSLSCCERLLSRFACEGDHKMICCARKDSNENPIPHSLRKVGTGMLTSTDHQPSNMDKELMYIEMNSIEPKASKVFEKLKVEVKQEVQEIVKVQKTLGVTGGEDEIQQVTQGYTYGAAGVTDTKMNTIRLQIMSEEASVVDKENRSLVLMI